MVRATYVVECDWNNDGTYTGTGENLTARTIKLEWSRGRDYASQLTGKSVATRLTAILDNESGDYNSFNTSSPLSGSLLPGRSVRIRTTAPTSVTLWQGKLDSIIPELGLRSLQQARLEAVGPLGFLSSREVRIPMQSNTLSGVIINTILNQAGWASADRSVDAGIITVKRYEAEDIAAIEALREIEESEIGFLSESKDNKVVFEDRDHRLKSDHLTSQATFTDATTGTLGYQEIVQEDPLPNIFNIFEAKLQTFTVGTLAVLWTHPEANTSGTAPLVEQGSGSAVFYAFYPSPAKELTDIGVDAWTTPLATSDYQGFSDTAGTGTDLTTALSLSVSKFARAMKLTFTNTGTKNSYITKLQARGTPVTKDNPVVIEAIDGSSTAIYGERKWPVPAEWLADGTAALNYVRYLKGIYPDPIPILSMTVFANRDNAHLTQALVRNISDRVTVVATSTRTNLGINQAFYIENEHHVVTQHRVHMVTWGLSSFEGYSKYWVLDTSKLGQDTALSF